MSVINLNSLEFRYLLNEANLLRISVRTNWFDFARKISKMGTSNVHGLKTTGKLAVIENETKRVGLLI